MTIHRTVMQHASNRKVLAAVQRALRALRALDDMRYDNQILANHDAATAVSSARFTLAALEARLLGEGTHSNA